MLAEPLVQVRRVSKHFDVTTGRVFRRKVGETVAVDAVSFDIGRGETVGLVGESGSGKSTVGRLILALQTPTAGEVRFDGTPISRLSPAELRPWRKHMQIVFQDPLATLNPRRTVGESIARPLLNFGTAPSVARRKAADLMARVGLDPALANRYPHQFSGGQCQRVGIARALALDPAFLFLDEPTSALDVSVQAQIVNLLSDIRADLGLSYLFVSHNLRLVRHLADRMVVLYRGRVVEIGAARAVYGAPRHPYTQALRQAAGGDVDAMGAAPEGGLADAAAPADAATPWLRRCAFAGSCSRRFAACTQTMPVLHEVGDGHRVACHLFDPQLAPKAVALQWGAASGARQENDHVRH